MSLENIMQIAGMSMDAQTVRMNLSVSNVSNADTVSDSPLLPTKQRGRCSRRSWSLKLTERWVE